MATPSAPYRTSKVDRGLVLLAELGPRLYIETEGRIAGERSAHDRAAMRAAVAWIEAKCRRDRQTAPAQENRHAQVTSTIASDSASESVK